MRKREDLQMALCMAGLVVIVRTRRGRQAAGADATLAANSNQRNFASTTISMSRIRACPDNTHVGGRHPASHYTRYMAMAVPMRFATCNVRRSV